MSCETGTPAGRSCRILALASHRISAAMAADGVLLRTRPPPIVRTLSVSLAVGVAVAFAISWFAALNVLGRHMAVFFPLMLLIGCSGWSDPSSGASRTIRSRPYFVLAVTWGISDVRLVLLPQYKKDDYRDAASIALQNGRSHRRRNFVGGRSTYRALLRHRSHERPPSPRNRKY